MQGQHILIIEDDDLNRELINDLIDLEGYNVENAVDGHEALEKIENKNFDLIILDIKLPKMSGFELLPILKNHPKTKNIPIIVVTAYAMKGDRERFMELGCDYYIPKPIDTNVFNTYINKFLSVNY